MLDQIFGLLAGRNVERAAAGEAELRLCVAALLVEAARMNEHFDEAERAAIERLLSARFGLCEAETGALLAAAETAVRQSTQLLRFTDCVVRLVKPEDRARIIEMMWEVAYADGSLDPNEDALLRRIAGLIHVSDRDRGLARQKAMRRLGLE